MAVSLATCGGNAGNAGNVGNAGSESAGGGSTETLKVGISMPQKTSENWVEAEGFFNGAMSILEPKIKDGTLVVGSGQTKQSQAATQGWDPKNAQSRMDAILAQNYPGSEVPAGILSPNDTLARAVLTSVQQAGKEQPVVTGQDSEVESLKWIMEGKQYSTISKPTLPLVQASLELAVKLASGEKDVKELNGIKVDEKQYNNNKKDVPSFLLEPIVATKDNAKDVYKDEPKKLEAVNSVG